MFSNLFFQPPAKSFPGKKTIKISLCSLHKKFWWMDHMFVLRPTEGLMSPYCNTSQKFIMYYKLIELKTLLSKAFSRAYLCISPNWRLNLPGQLFQFKRTLCEYNFVKCCFMYLQVLPSLLCWIYVSKSCQIQPNMCKIATDMEFVKCITPARLSILNTGSVFVLKYKLTLVCLWNP